MSHYAARIENDVVTQVVVGHAQDVADLLPGVWIPIEEDSVYPGMGWLWDGMSFTPPPSIDETPDGI